MSIVSVVRSDNYDSSALVEAVSRHFETLRIEEDLKPDMHVLIKPNLLSARRPDQVVTTNPALISAVVDWLRDHGVSHITLADSPSGPYVQSALHTIYSVSGMKALADKVELNYSTSWRTVSCPDSFANKSFNIIEPILDADYIINVAKVKTHAMTTYSGGIKNLFGSIPGLQKPEMHYKFPDIDTFSRMLLELSQMVAPAVTVLDAVDGMEGNGPNGGTPRHLGATLASRDVYALDYYASTLIGLEPNAVSMIRQAAELDLFDPAEINVIGDTDIDPVQFKMPDTVLSVDFMSAVPKFFKKPAEAILNKFLHPYPQLETGLCVGCGKCAESCPAKIITIKNGVAHFQRKNCISCFCCQEVCPIHAIGVKRLINL